MKESATFFDFAAEVGLTKHIGGLEATEALADLCHVGEGKYVLDVGCGVGVTPCYLAKRHHCRMVGVDILEGMIAKSRKRAKQEGVEDQVEFRVADAQELPFEDNTFDVTITESATAFPLDKKKAVDEYVRVTKPGGYIGLNESTWIKFPPPPQILDWVAQDIGANVMPLTAAEWSGLLETAGLDEISTRTFLIDLQVESKGILQRYGWMEILGIFGRMLSLYFRSAAYRKFVREVQQERVIPENLNEYFGYGLYMGRKRSLEA